MIYESPSGSPELQATTVEVDWGTVGPGDNVSFAITPFNVVGQEVKKPFWPCPLSVMPPGINAFSVPANIEGAPAALLIVNNATAGPLFVGVKKYAILYGSLDGLL